jgi:tetratricopeptide (TPR) repeat protein
VLVAALLLIKKHRRMIVFGLFFYIANLAMVLQLLPFGKAIVAERYAYVPMLGILFIVAYLLNQLRKKFAENKIAYAVLFWIIPAGAFVAFSILTQQRTKVWKDSSSLFADVVAKYPDRAYAHYALGNSKNSANDLQGALQCYSRAASLEPYADVYNNRGWIYYALQNYQAAIDDFDRAIELDTTNSQFFFGRGMTYMALMKHELAGVDFVKAASITPGYVDALTNAAYCAYSRNKMAEAIAWYQTAYFYAPGSATIPFNLGLIYKGVGAKDQACNYIGIAASKGSVPAQQTQNEYCK